MLELAFSQKKIVLHNTTTAERLLTLKRVHLSEDYSSVRHGDLELIVTRKKKVTVSQHFSVGTESFTTDLPDGDTHVSVVFDTPTRSPIKSICVLGLAIVLVLGCLAVFLMLVWLFIAIGQFLIHYEYDRSALHLVKHKINNMNQNPLFTHERSPKWKLILARGSSTNNGTPYFNERLGEFDPFIRNRPTQSTPFFHGGCALIFYPEGRLVFLCSPFTWPSTPYTPSMGPSDVRVIATSYHTWSDKVKEKDGLWLNMDDGNLYFDQKNLVHWK